MKKYLLLSIALLFGAMAMAQDIADKGILKLTIYYLYAADSSQAHTKYMKNLMSEGDTYSVPSPVIENFLPDRDTVQGVMPNHNVVDTVFYTYNPPIVVPHTVEVDSLIVNGTVTVVPTGEVVANDTITITVTPNENYELATLSAYNKADATEMVTIANNKFVMPDFDVVVTATFARALPVITGTIEELPSICSGSVLSLVEPQVANADETAWQMSPTALFVTIVEYTGQTLDMSYNGWKLRFMAFNESGEVYSNVVTITVRSMDDITLSGDLSACTNQECEYHLTGAAGGTCTWSVSDDNAVVTETANGIKVVWGTQGIQTVTADVQTSFGCTAVKELDVNVLAFVNDSDLNEIVAKKHDGKAYMLIYPNPKDTYKYQWYKDNVAIEGASGQYYYPEGGLKSGDYKVYVSLNTDADGNLICGAYTKQITIGGSKDDFSIYPNPAMPSDVLSVVVPNGDRVELSLYAVDGRLIHSQTVGGTETQISVNLLIGVYVAHFIKDSETIVTKKIVIE